ncbi:MAG: hypothetical protein ACOYD9_00440 [Pyramidobacter sp.]
MFIPIEGEDCIFLQNAVAFVHDERRTTVYYTDGSTTLTGFRPVTLARRYRKLMRTALRPAGFAAQEVNDR